MFGVILSIGFIICCLWVCISSAIGAYRWRERTLTVLSGSALLIAIGQTIPLINLLIGGFGDSMETWLGIQLAISLAAIAGIATFNIPLGGLARLRTKGISFKFILLLRRK